MSNPRTILVVDDDSDIRHIVADILCDEGYRALGAEDGRHALRMFRAEDLRPQLILLDMMTPELDGGFRAEQQRDAELAPIRWWSSRLTRCPARPPRRCRPLASSRSRSAWPASSARSSGCVRSI